MKCVNEGCLHEVESGKCYCCRWEGAKLCTYQERLIQKEQVPVYYLREAGRLLGRFIDDMPAYQTNKREELTMIKNMIFAWCEGKGV